MHFTGRVTAINTEFCTFELNGKQTVHCGLLFGFANKIFLPAIDSTVNITDVQYYNKTIFLTSNSRLFWNKLAPKSVQTSCCYMVQLIKKYGFNCFDLHNFVQAVNKLKRNDVISRDFLVQHNLNSDLCARDFVAFCCDFVDVKANKTLFDKSSAYNFHILTPSDHKLENGEQIVAPAEWTFGVHYFQNNECLIGYLSVSNSFGFITLADSQYYIVCIIAPDLESQNSKKMLSMLNNMVLIKKYYVFLEKTKNYELIHYVFVNIRDVHLMNCMKQSEINEKKDDESVSINIKVIHRCSVSYKSGYLDCWVQCEIQTQDNKNYRECFIKLHGTMFKKYPAVNPGDEYIFSSKSPKFAREMKNFSSDKSFNVDGRCVPVFSLPQDGALDLVLRPHTGAAALISHDFSLMDVAEVKEITVTNKHNYLKMDLYDHIMRHKKKSKELVSFEAVIKKRKTVPPNKTLPKAVAKHAFGIHGTQVHQLIFEAPKPDRTQARVTLEALSKKQLRIYLKDDLSAADKIYAAHRDAQGPREINAPLYMHNWTQLQTPLGLVEGMKVAVRKVMYPDTATYLKPTFLTRIEPLEYVPKQKFETAFEYRNNHNWGPSTPLAASHYIPKPCLCWGSTTLLQFTTLKAIMRCPSCGAAFTPSQESCCSPGPQSEAPQPPKLDLMFGLKGRDSTGVFDMMSKQDEVLSKLLGLRDKEWGTWRKGMKVAKYWTMHDNDWKEKQLDDPRLFRSDEEESFAEMFSHYITWFNTFNIHKFDLKCRKMDKKENDFNLNQKWYLLEIRLSDNKNNYYFYS